MYSNRMLCPAHSWEHPSASDSISSFSMDLFSDPSVHFWLFQPSILWWILSVFTFTSRSNVLWISRSHPLFLSLSGRAHKIFFHFSIFSFRRLSSFSHTLSPDSYANSGFKTSFHLFVRRNTSKMVYSALHADPPRSRSLPSSYYHWREYSTDGWFFVHVKTEFSASYYLHLWKNRCEITNGPISTLYPNKRKKIRRKLTISASSFIF